MARDVDEREAYTCNTTADAAIERLRVGERLAILTHSKPDGDAVGSTLALARALHHIGKKAWPVYMVPWAHRFDEIVDATEVIHVTQGCWAKPPLHKIDTIVICDTGSWAQVSDAQGWLEDRAHETLVIDHHAGGDADIAEQRFIDTSAAAACEIVADIAVQLLGVESAAHLPSDIATALFIGIATDTGWFRHSNTTPRTHRLAADLIEAGAEPTRLFAMMYQTDEATRMRLLQRALASLRWMGEERAAMMVLRRKDFDETKASNDETGGFTDILQSVASVKVVALVTELDSQTSKISLRSKSDGDFVDVNALASRLGGGGHVHAAGAKVRKPIDETVEELAALLEEAVS